MATKTPSSSFRRFLFYVSLLGLLLFGVYGYRLIWGVPLNIDHFADRGLILAIRPYPELITFLGMIENTALDFHSDKLSDLSPASQAAVVESSREQFEMLQHYDRSELSGQQAITYDYLYWRMVAKLQAFDFPWHFDNEMYQGPYPANQTQGQQDLPLKLLASSQRVVDAESAERYLARMEALAPYLDNLQAAMAYRADLGVIPPAIIMQHLIEQAAMLVSTPAEKWGLYVALEEKLAETGLVASEQSALLARNARLIESVVIPNHQIC